MFALATAPMHALSVTIQASWTVHIGGGQYRHECNLCDIRGPIRTDWLAVDAERDAHDDAEHVERMQWDADRSVWIVPEDASQTPVMLAQSYPGQVFAYADDVQTYVSMGRFF